MILKGREFKIGILGCGRISQSYMQAIQGCPDLNLAAVMDTREEAARAAAEAAGAKAFTDVDDFVKNSGVEGAVICAPPVDHRPLACALMRGGIHVLCEKPFATTIDDAMTMVNTATETELILMMASKFRYVEDVIRAKAIIASGMLGEIQFYENRFCAKVNMRGRWNSDPAIGGGGVLIDNGTHSVDIVRYLLGPISRIHASAGKNIQELPVEETAGISLVTESGALGTVYLSWSIKIEEAGYINIFGSDGALTIGWKGSRFQHNGHSEWVSFGVGYNKVGAFKNQVSNFVNTVRGGESPIITAEDGLASVRAVEAAYRSMSEGKWIELEAKSSLPNPSTNS